MTIDNDNDLEALKRIGAIVANTLHAMGKALEPGVTTRELDEIGRVFAGAGRGAAGAGADL